MITIQNTNTGVVTNLTSDNTGVYDAASLDPGTYSISFAREGFKKDIKTNIILHVEAITVNATMQVGSVSQTVEVKGGAALIQTETSDKGSTLTSDAIAELPSVNRFWFDYTYLLPGSNGTMTGTAGFNGAGVGFNGQGGYQMLGLMDGGTATMLPAQNYTIVPIQTISEIQMETSNFSAEYSNGLAVFNVILKSGTNRFHGEGFEFVQNNKLEARNTFTPSIPPLRWNMYGGTVGGPIKKDKLFFFFGYQNNPNISYSNGITTYPTAAERQGNLAGLPPIYDPNTLVQNADGTYSRTAFTGNIIPSGTNGTNRIDPAAAKIMSYYPLPNIAAAGLTNNYYYASPNPITTKTYDWKINWNISPGNRLNVSQNYVDLNGPVGGQFWPTCYEKIDCVSEGVHMQTDVISDVWSISPNIVNEYRESFQRSWQPYLAEDLGKNWSSTLGIPNLTATTFPGITMNGLGSPDSIGTSFKHALLGYTTVTEADTLTIIRGKHILKFGGEYNNSRDNLAWGDIDAGNFNFSGQFTENPASAATIAATGTGFADFLLGVPNTWSDGWTPADGNRTGNAQAFAQDDFKITPKLTLNFGIRWLQQRGYTEEFKRLGSFDPTITNPADGTLGAMWYGGQRAGIRANGNDALQATIWSNFEPRLGFAWSPRNNTSIRGGYGLFDNMWGGDTYQGGVGTGISVAGNDYAHQPLVPFMQLSNGHAPPAIPVFPPSASFYNGSGVTFAPYHIPEAYVQQWHLSVQHQFKGDTMVEVGYVGSRGTHLADPSDIDQVPESAIQAHGGIGVNMQPYRPWPNFTGITYEAQGGWSVYHSLQLTVKKNLSHGLWFQSSYTWSHATDTNTQNGWNGAESDYQIALSPSTNYGNAQIDERHLFNGSFIYHLPVGRGHALLNQGGVLDGVLGGWQLSNTWQAVAGSPFTPTWGGGGSDYALSGTWRPNRTCNGALSNHTTSEWFNWQCFPSAGSGNFGNSGRDILYGPSFFNMDTSLAKNFKLHYLGEAGQIQIRIDATDVLNHANYGTPNTSVIPSTPTTPTTTGVITSASTQRIVQLGARIVF